MAEKRYYWLKLKENFFNEKYIKALRRLPQGDSLVIVFLKMELASLKTDGVLKYENFMSDYISELALELDEDENIVRLTVEALVRFGIVEQYDNDTLYITTLENQVGTETSNATRVRKHRETKALQCNTDETKCNTDETKCNTDETKCNTDETKCNTEIEKEIDIDIEKEIDIEKDIEKEKEKEKEKENVCVSYEFDNDLSKDNNLCKESTHDILPENKKKYGDFCNKEHFS